MFLSKETTADHHQVPRMRIKRVPGTIKTETGTGRANGGTFAPGTGTSLEPLKHSLFGEQNSKCESRQDLPGKCPRPN